MDAAATAAAPQPVPPGVRQLPLEPVEGSTMDKASRAGGEVQDEPQVKAIKGIIAKNSIAGGC